MFDRNATLTDARPGHVGSVGINGCVGGVRVCLFGSGERKKKENTQEAVGVPRFLGTGARFSDNQTKLL